MRRFGLRNVLGALTGIILGSAHATTLYFGQDINAGTPPAAFSASLDARDRFLATVGPSFIESFESLPTGDGFITGARPPITSGDAGNSMTIDVTIALAEVWHHVLGGRYAFSGTNYLLFAGNSVSNSALEVSFARPVRAFGFAAVDAGDFAERLSMILMLSNGATESITIPHRIDDLAANASAFFFGVTTDVSFTQLRIENSPVSSGTPYIAFDDFVMPLVASTPSPSLPAIPEPGLFMLWLSGIACLWLARHERIARTSTSPCTVSRARRSR